MPQLEQIKVVGDARSIAIYDLATKQVRIQLWCARCRRTLDVFDFQRLPPGVRSSNLYYGRRVAHMFIAGSEVTEHQKIHEPWPSIRKQRLDRHVPTDRYSCYQRLRSGICGATYDFAKADLANAAVDGAIADEDKLWAVARAGSLRAAKLVPGSRFDHELGGSSNRVHERARPSWRPR